MKDVWSGYNMVRRMRVIDKENEGEEKFEWKSKSEEVEFKRNSQFEYFKNPRIPRDEVTKEEREVVWEVRKLHGVWYI